MRRKVGIFILVFGSAMFLMSAITELTVGFYKLRSTPTALKSWWGSDRAGAGDLYGLTALPQFSNPDPTLTDPSIKLPNCGDTTHKSYNIYALVDSYGETIFSRPNNFCQANKVGYTFSNNGEELPIYLDKTRKNVLMIECVERSVRKGLVDTDYLMRFIKVSKEKLNEAKTAEEVHGFHLNFKIKGNDPDYETNLWDFRFLRPLKQLKAKVTLDWFNRTYVDAKLAPDGKYLLYQCTVDTSYIESSFRPVGDAEINNLIIGLNKVYDHYKQQGFDEVYLSIIPNPVTILYPHYHGYQYNGLIPRLQGNPALKLKVFDVYNLFNNSPDKDKLYQHADTHWNKFGRRVWLNAFNKEMAQNK